MQIWCNTSYKELKSKFLWNITCATAMDSFSILTVPVRTDTEQFETVIFGTVSNLESSEPSPVVSEQRVPWTSEEVGSTEPEIREGPWYRGQLSRGVPVRDQKEARTVIRIYGSINPPEQIDRPLHFVISCECRATSTATRRNRSGAMGNRPGPIGR